MSNFWRRLRYYGIGFGIGLIFVVFFFNNRGCSWTPSNRVKTALLQRIIALPESQTEAFAAKKITPKQLNKFIEEAEIDFGASNKTSANKFYKLTKGEKTLFFTLTNESFISSVFTHKPKQSDWKKGKAKLVVFPNQKEFIFTDTTGSQRRIRAELGFKDDKQVWKQMQKNASVVYDNCDFINALKPEHYIVFQTKKGKEIATKSVWYKDKINISNYIIGDSLQ